MNTDKRPQPWLWLLLLLLAWPSERIGATTINFTAYPLLATYHPDGLYNLVGLGTWNGQPVTPDNMPNATQRYLAASINLYSDPNALNVLYFQVTDVLTAEGAFWFGTAFDNVTLTGLRVTRTSGALPPAGPVAFSGDLANPGQVRAYSGSTESVEPLTSTPGYQLDQIASNVLLIHTIAGAENGFTSLANITGASRIRGGGVFQLSFAPYINVRGLDFANISVEAEYGRGNQYITAFALPEPSSVLLVMAGLTGIALASRKIKRTCKCS